MAARIFALWLIASSDRAFGATIIDQVSPGGGSNAQSLESTGAFGQSFTPAQSNLAGFGLALKGNTTTNLTIQIWDQLWTAPTANLVVTQSATVTAGVGFVINDIFWTPVAVTAGQRYFARFFAPNGGVITGGFIFNPYAGGTVINNNSPGFEAGTGAIDITFRTFYESDFQSSVPEPATGWLFASTLGALAIWRRR